MRYGLAALMLISALIVGAWDIVAVARGTPADTVSRTMLDWSAIYPVLPLVIGIILGHTFWPQRVMHVAANIGQ